MALAIAAGLLVALLSGCASLRFYAQAVTGQGALLLARRDVSAVLADGATPPRLAAQLRLATAMLRFADESLAMPPGGRYRSYVEVTGAPVWNVVAAQELALTPVSRCYPVVGCAIYRGYFSRSGAEREAARLAATYDVHVYPVAAYSTLGWFDDPLLSSFIMFAEPDLAALLFHELAHSVYFLPGDSTFNESYANFVGAEGAVAWLRSQGRDAVAHRRALAAKRRAERAFAAFLGHWRERLRSIYALPVDDAAKRQLKGQAFQAMRADYHACREELGGGRFDGFMAAPLSNAKLLAVGAYEDLAPGFARLFEAAGRDWRTFFREVQALAALPEPARRKALATPPGEPSRCGTRRAAPPDRGGDDDAAAE